MTKSDLLVEEAIACLNVPYIWGGNNPLQGFDCSGLVCWCLKRIGYISNGVDLSAVDLYNLIASHSLQTPEKGALLFFGQSVNQIHHVAIAIDDLRMIEAAYGDRNVRSPLVATTQGAMVMRNQISRRNDLIAICTI